MAKQYTIRVSLGADTKQAQDALRRLNAKASGKDKATRTRTGRLRQTLRAIAFSAPVIRLAQLGRGEVDVWAESVVPEMATAAEFLADKTGYTKSKKAARESVRSDSAQLVGHLGYVPSQVRDLYEWRKRMLTMEEKGLYTLRQDRRFSGPDLGTMTKAAVTGYGRLINSSFEYWQKELF